MDGANSFWRWALSILSASWVVRGRFLFRGMARQSGWPGRRKEKEVGEWIIRQDSQTAKPVVQPLLSVFSPSLMQAISTVNEK
jgi:hypothetical protein